MIGHRRENEDVGWLREVEAGQVGTDQELGDLLQAFHKLTSRTLDRKYGPEILRRNLQIWFIKERKKRLQLERRNLAGAWGACLFTNEVAVRRFEKVDFSNVFLGSAYRNVENPDSY